MRKKFGLEGLMMDEESSDDEKVLEEITKGKLTEEYIFYSIIFIREKIKK